MDQIGQPRSPCHAGRHEQLTGLDDTALCPKSQGRGGVGVSQVAFLFIYEGTMDESRDRAAEPSSRRRSTTAAHNERMPAARMRANVTKTGRPSYDEYARRVSQVLRWTPFQLDSYTPLAQLPGVQARVRRHPTAMLPLGTALRSLIDEAVGDVEEVALAGQDPASKRLATFLRIWYRERGTVVRVAEALGLTRTHVARQIQRPALALVVRRFLDLAWRAQLSA